MKFILSSLLVFLCVFAKAQVPPPMVLGGPQGIDVTRLLARNWMSTPIYTDTPSSPLTGAGWPGRGYLITVVRNETACQNCPPKDTTLWMYTGARWKRVGYDYLTRLVYGGTVSKASGQNLQYIIQPYGAFFDGDYKIGATSKTAVLSPKTIDNTSRVDVLVLNRDSFLVKTGIPSVIPKKPLITGSEVEVASFYFKAFDSIPTVINTSSKVTNIFRIPGIDSFYFNIDTLTFAVKDSVGITKNDTAFMLNNYKFTAANGLTKDSTVFRLGGSLNQNTNINLNTRRLSFIGGSDTTRFFSNGRVSIGGTPDSLSMLRVNGTTRITGNTTYNGNLLPLPIGSGSMYVAGFTRGVNAYDPAKLQVYTNEGIAPIQCFELDFYQTTLNSINNFDSISFNYDRNKFRTIGAITSQRGGGTAVTDIRMSPTFRVGPRSTDTSTYYGARFVPIVDSANKVNIIPFSNTIGSNMFNTTRGNTRIGYPYAFQTPIQFDTTFKLDVNGSTRIIGNTVYNGNLLPLPILSGSLYAAGFTRGVNTYDPAKLQVYTNSGLSPIQSLDFGFYQTTLNSPQTFDSIGFGYQFSSFRTAGAITSQRGGGTSITDIFMNPTFRVGANNVQTSTHYGARFAPIVDSANKVNIIPFSNTIGSNMFNTTRGNTRIGYPYGFQTPTQFDTTFKLDVNGTARVMDTLTLSTTPVTADTSANDLLVINSSNGQVRRYTGNWYSVPLTGSAPLDFPSTGHGNSADLTFTVTGASEGDVVALGIPNASIVANASFTAWVSATDTITVRFNNYASSGSSDPANGTFKIKVFK
jgi:hypothetical protein